MLTKRLPVVKVRIHTIAGLKEVLGHGDIELPVPQGATIRALLALMVKRWGEGLVPYFSDFDHARPLPHVRILVRGQDIAFLDGIDTQLSEGDEVLLLPLVGGG